MDIDEQFTGLDMSALINEPLKTTDGALMELTQSTGAFIKSAGFAKDGNPKSTSFKFDKQLIKGDGTFDTKQMKLNPPLLSIVPIPNLQMDELNVIFNMEVHETVGSEEKVVASVTGITEPSGLKVSISGLAFTNTDSNSINNQAEYHIHVNNKNDQQPENLAEILEIMSDTIEIKEK